MMMDQDTMNLLGAAGGGAVLQPVLKMATDKFPVLAKAKPLLPLLSSAGLAAFHAAQAGLPWQAALVNTLVMAGVAHLKHDFQPKV